MSIKQGEYLKKLRAEHNLSQEQLSEILGISRQSISKWEQGNSAPDIENLTNLSEYYGVSVDSLVKGEPDEFINGESITVAEKTEEKEDTPDSSEKKKGHSWLFAGFPFIAVIGYCVIGALFGGKGWAFGWIVLLTIPLFYTSVIAIKKKKPIVFCYPVLVLMIYLFLGLAFSLWHPLWIIFLTIPLFYIITAKANKKR